MKILLLSPHTDDVELAMGGTVIKLLEQYGPENIRWEVFSACEDTLPNNRFLLPAENDVLRKEFSHVMDALAITQYYVHHFKVRTLPAYRQEILDILHTVKKNYQPDLVYCPSRFDVHQDHQVVCNEAIRCFRTSASILGYYSLRNCLEARLQKFERLTEIQIEQKISVLQFYQSQFALHRTYFSDTFIRSIATVMGTYVQHPFAEAFEVIRWIQ